MDKREISKNASIQCNYFTNNFYKVTREQSTSFPTTPVNDATSTQTSTTVTKLVDKLEKTTMTPDSLSPRDEQSFHLDYARKSNVLQYLESCDNTSQSLVRTFLEKNQKRNYTGSKIWNEQSTTAIKIDSNTRSCFLQQTSPLNKLLAKKADEKVEITASPQRFFIKKIRDNQTVNKQPLKCFPVGDHPKHLEQADEKINSSPNLFQSNRRSNSFMSPTISSENKQSIVSKRPMNRLMARTRKGRSLSPRKLDVNDKVPSCVINASELNSERSFKNSVEPNSFHLDIKSSHDDSFSADVPEQHVVLDVTFYNSMCKLRNQEWDVAIKGLTEIVDVCREVDSDVVYPHMTAINQRLIELLKSPRSHVSRTACQAAGHLFEYVKDTRRPEFDEIVDILLTKTADSNKFIRQDANLALDCMVTHLPTIHSIRALTMKGPDHKNSLVRTATARLMTCAVVIAGIENILNSSHSEHTRKRVILNMVKFLEDKCSDTRKFGQKLHKQMQRSGNFEVILKKYLEHDTILRISKIVKNYVR